MWRFREARSRAFALFLMIAVLAWVRATSLAHAATPPVAAGCVLGFGAAYAAGGQSRTHLGADLGGAPGVDVAAPVAGTVVFAGEVPATDGSGGRAGCVTIASGSDRWTLLPLDPIGVRSGQEVAEGEPVGGLAQGGDGSSPGTHLHVGLRRGTVYVDPVAQLSAAAAAGSGGAADAVHDRDPDDERTGDRGRPGTAAAGAAAGACAPTPAGSPRPVGRPAPSVAQPAAGASLTSPRARGLADRARPVAHAARARGRARPDARPLSPMTATAGAVRLAAVIALSACATTALAVGAVSVRRSMLQEREEAVEARAGP